MSLDVSPLFQPLRVKGYTLRNRIVMPPMVVLHGHTTPDGIEWYGRHARGGVALVIVEATPVQRFGADLTLAGLKQLTQAIHDGGALAAIQILPVERGTPLAPAALSLAQIEDTVEQYRRAAQLCAAAGFDGIEPHGAHGFLLNQFFSPTQNRRTDRYGGSLENRMRLALEIVQAVRPALGPDRLLLYRHTPISERLGYGMEESLALAERLVAAGVDILDISPSSVEYPGDRAAPFTRFGVPIIAVNNLEKPERALEVLREGRAQLIAIGRALIADPDWPIKVREGRFDDIIECVKCDEGCYGNLRKGIPVACTQW